MMVMIVIMARREENVHELTEEVVLSSQQGFESFVFLKLRRFIFTNLHTALILIHSYALKISCIWCRSVGLHQFCGWRVPDVARHGRSVSFYWDKSENYLKWQNLLHGGDSWLEIWQVISKEHQLGGGWLAIHSILIYKDWNGFKRVNHTLSTGKDCLIHP